MIFETFSSPPSFSLLYPPVPKNHSSFRHEEKSWKDPPLLPILLRGFRTTTNFFLMNKVLKHFWPSVQKYRSYYLAMLLLLLATISLEMLIPYWYKQIANVLSTSQVSGSLGALLQTFWSLVGTYAVIWTLWRFFEYCIVQAESKTMRDLEVRCFAALQQKSMRFFEGQFSGSLVKKAGRFVRAFEGMTDWFYFTLLNTTLQVLFVLAIFFVFQPIFAVIFLLWTILFLGGNIWFARWKMQFDERVASQDSKIGGMFADAFANILAVKSFAEEHGELGRITEASEDLFQKRKKAWFLTNIAYAVQAFLMIGAELVLIFFMIRAWEAGELTVGDFVFFQTYILLLFHRIWDFGRNLQDFFQHVADAQEMVSFFEMQEEIKEKPGAPALVTRGAEIKWENVSFGYDPGKPHFENLSLQIARGEKVAFVGHSGSGKSTMIKLLFRFFDVQQGSVQIDGQDVRDVSLESLRSQIALVPQEAQLFHRSLLENVAFAKKDASKAEVQEALKKANALSFTEKLPQGFKTIVGERGVKLSGGERQRIALARSFLADSPIIVLDEATSALDSITEAEIQEAMFRLLEGRTAILIAHRLSTIQQMDRIIVFEEGHIVEEGTHKKLLQNETGLYKTMWDRQVGGFLGE